MSELYIVGRVISIPKQIYETWQFPAQALFSSNLGLQPTLCRLYSLDKEIINSVVIFLITLTLLK